MMGKLNFEILELERKHEYTKERCCTSN